MQTKYILQKLIGVFICISCTATPPLREDTVQTALKKNDFNTLIAFCRIQPPDKWPFEYINKFIKIQEKTALHEASSSINGDEHLIRLLVDNGANINAKTFLAGERPLHIATHDKTGSAIKALVQLNANLHVRDLDGIMPLHMAIRGSYNATRILLCNGANPNGQIQRDMIDLLPFVPLGNNRSTPLHVAIMLREDRIHENREREKKIQSLLEHGADMDMQDSEQYVPRDYGNHDDQLYLDAARDLKDNGYQAFFDNLDEVPRENDIIRYIKLAIGQSPAEAWGIVNTQFDHYMTPATYSDIMRLALRRYHSTRSEHTRSALHAFIHNMQQRCETGFEYKGRDGMEYRVDNATRYPNELVDQVWNDFEYGMESPHVVDDIITRYPEINFRYRDENGNTPLHKVARCPNGSHLIPRLVTLFSQKTESIPMWNNQGKTPYTIARTEYCSPCVNAFEYTKEVRNIFSHNREKPKKSAAASRALPQDAINYIMHFVSGKDIPRLSRTRSIVYPLTETSHNA